MLVQNGITNMLDGITSFNSLTEKSILEKVGAKTGFTDGRYYGHISFRLVYSEPESFSLHNQILMRPIKCNYFGDFGSLVTLGNMAVGILTGHSTDGMDVVTPIWPISDTLRKDGWTISYARNHNNNVEEMDTNP